MDSLALILIAVAVLAGIALGWFLGGRPVSDWKARHAERDAEAKEHEAQFRQAVAELGQVHPRLFQHCRGLIDTVDAAVWHTLR